QPSFGRASRRPVFPGRFRPLTLTLSPAGEREQVGSLPCRSGGEGTSGLPPLPQRGRGNKWAPSPAAAGEGWGGGPERPALSEAEGLRASGESKPVRGELGEPRAGGAGPSTR